MKVEVKNVEEDEQKAQPKEDVKDSVVIIIPIKEDKDTAAVKVETPVADTTQAE